MQFRPPAIAHDAIEIRRFSLIVYTLIGASMLWTFGDTLMTVTGADGFNYRSSTGAWGAPGQLALDDALDLRVRHTNSCPTQRSVSTEVCPPAPAVGIDEPSAAPTESAGPPAYQLVELPVPADRGKQLTRTARE